MEVREVKDNSLEARGGREGNGKVPRRPEALGSRPQKLARLPDLLPAT